MKEPRELATAVDDKLVLAMFAELVESHGGNSTLLPLALLPDDGNVCNLNRNCD